MGHAEEILTQTPSSAQPLPFTEAQIASAKPVFSYKTWGPEFTTCTAKPEKVDLELLVTHIEALAAAAGPLCRTPEEDLVLAASWSLAGQQGNQSIQAGCLAKRQAFRSATETIANLATKLCNSQARQTAAQ